MLHRPRAQAKQDCRSGSHVRRRECGTIHPPARVTRNPCLIRTTHPSEADESLGDPHAPLRQQATAVVRRLHEVLQDALPIIAAGGIMCAADANEKIEAGASLVQIYSGLIYRGPGLVSEIARSLRGLDMDGARMGLHGRSA